MIVAVDVRGRLHRCIEGVLQESQAQQSASERPITTRFEATLVQPARAAVTFEVYDGRIDPASGLPPVR